MSRILIYPPVEPPGLGRTVFTNVMAYKSTTLRVWYNGQLLAPRNSEGNLSYKELSSTRVQLFFVPDGFDKLELAFQMAV